ncbi:MAG: hypothetical protein AAF600_02750 [Bacteroidota bacterium]
MATRKIEKIIGIAAGLAGIFGLYITIYGVPPWLKGHQNKKYTFEASVFLGEPSITNSYFKEGDTLRLEETLSLRWSGVKSCGEDSRVKQEYDAAFNGWVESSKIVIDTLRHLNSNFEAGESHSKQSQAPFPSNARSCEGSGSIKCWIEFVK